MVKYIKLTKKVQKDRICIRYLSCVCFWIWCCYKNRYEGFLSQFNKLIGKNKIACFDLNDSKEPLNLGRIDESLFLGYIGKPNKRT